MFNYIKSFTGKCLTFSRRKSKIANTMMLKVFCGNKEKFDHTLESIMDIAAVVCSGGYLPTQRDKNHPELGRVWTFKHPTYELVPVNNNYKAHIKDSGDNMGILWFVYRYDRDRDGLMDALVRLLHARFPEQTELIEE
jgi:hypothetical protein